jgi:hypothetical protein
VFLFLLLDAEAGHLFLAYSSKNGDIHGLPFIESSTNLLAQLILGKFEVGTSFFAIKNTHEIIVANVDKLEKIHL